MREVRRADLMLKELPLPIPTAAPDLFAGEAPRYPDLATVVRGTWSSTRLLMATLRRDWFVSIGLDDPKRTGSRQARLLSRVKSTARLFGRKSLTDAQKADLDAAIGEFLRGYAGPTRTRRGFTDPDSEALLQQSEFLAYRVGVERGQQVASTDQDVELTEAVRRRITGEAFDRLTEGSRLRFETRLGEIKDAMLQGFSDGESPLDVARQLSRDLDSYETSRLATIVRTEMGIASERGIIDLYRADGITRAEVIGDPNTDELCTSHIGKDYPLDDDDNLPIYHPNCFCSTVPKRSD